MNKLPLNSKFTKTVIVITLLFFLAAPLFFITPVSADSGYIEKTFKWSYDGRDWTWTLNIPSTLYDDYNSVPESTRDANGLSGYGFLTTTKDTYVRMLAERLNETTTELDYGSFDQVSFILAFVQSLPYTSDSVTTGYDNFPRFPIETLVDDGGDCEDTAILFATLTLILGYGTVYINPEGHLAVGVLGNDLDGSYYTYNGKTYYYCETTGDGWTIGELPDEWKDETAHIYTINTNQQYTPNVIITTPAPTPSPEPTTRPTSIMTVQPSVAPMTSKPNASDTGDNFDTLLVVGIIIVVVVVIVAAMAGYQKRKQQATTYAAMPPPPPPPTQTATKFCSYCGAPNTATAVYCSSCGKQTS